jgi:molybdopterin-containing oxidoreductase family iron-sulfur binding subunit
MRELAGELNAGAVDTLVILGGNPAYDAPADLNFGAAMKKAAHTVHLGTERNETAVLAGWHLPEAHYLEAWGDARALDGTVTIQQPLIEPLFGGRTAAEVLARMTGYKDQRAYDIVRGLWATGGEEQWRKYLYDGVVPGTARPEVQARVDVNRVKPALAGAGQPSAGIEVSFYPSPSAYDGRFANNGWMQEAPHPMTKVTWDNAALMSPETARKLGVANEDVIALSEGGRTIEAPVFIQPGHADDAVSIELGYGRRECGRVGKGVGHDAYPLRTTSNFWSVPGVALHKTGRRYMLATTQEHHSMEGRDIVREASIADFSKNPKVLEKNGELKLFSLYGEHDYSKGNQWGMAIDLNACIGCNACLVACQAENNIPIVGKEQVARGREMHWIRMDRYYTGSEDDPQAVTQPMACQQCENAPCEAVCPVAATSHSPEGLNDMAYNRCVGTRYCSNNCPYKVRRFNFLDWHKDNAEPLKMVNNPDVSVRMRGVMEKCTYCVQRIQETKIRAKGEGRRELRDGEVKTACQQTCPAEAIVFGNINDPNSRVSQLRKNARNYSLLEELNTKPRTTYLAKLRNPNPELA